ncbi:hypothetical protein JCM11251_000423 [Rhodosporidiobolus azoricus]
MSTLLRLFAASAVITTAFAHIDLNYPTSQWSFTEEQQEQGGVCGGGSRVTAVAWGNQNAFVSLSGDAGNTVRVRLASSNSTTENVTVTDASSFNINLSEGATVPESGNLCLPINLPNSNVFVVGSKATLYVEATGEGETVSSCAEVVLVPADSGTSVAIEHGAAVSNPSGGNYTVRDFYCSNSTIPARECSCHCHGDHAHCDESCSSDRLTQANEQCTATEGSEAGSHSHSEEEILSSSGECDCHCHDDHEHCSGSCTDAQISDAGAQCAASQSITGLAAASSATAASGSVGGSSAAPAQQTGGGNRAGKNVVGGGLAAVLVLAGVVLF